MEEREKLEMIIRDLEAEIRVLSAKAESAEDTEDKKFYRALLLKKEARLLLEKDKELLVKDKELLLKEKEKEVLLLEKDKDLRKEKLMRLEMQGARGEIGSAAGLGVESTTGSGAAAGLGVGSAAGAGATVGPASDSEAAGGTILALQATVDQILSCVQQLHGLMLAGSSGAGGIASGSTGGTASGSRAGIAGGAGCRVANDSGGAGPAAGGRADAAGSEASGSDDDDEGLREAACDNMYAQALWSVLQLPEVYESVGLEEPPAFLQPPTKEEYLASFRAYEG
ncbi:hypothetical protein Vretimale_18299 [Volvox reticuliferus]|uniref:Uncharacterized protein n=1 Tax=Volvox reticuliferus TaxID=1737510 RepID=A0A8J4CIS6_9CHLO|nr:hypothetical protein Vretifemale_8767 [Volvox reticuliferus]GIM15527.1 hypothetical protein Vretimale_18299 [Volvox reticuliferus]